MLMASQAATYIFLILFIQALIYHMKWKAVKWWWTNTNFHFESNFRRSWP